MQRSVGKLIWLAILATSVLCATVVPIDAATPGAAKKSRVLLVADRADPYAKLPLGDPENVKFPTLSAVGADAGGVYTRRPSPKEGFSTHVNSGWDLPKRPVTGRVFEVREGKRIPLAGVIISDWQTRHVTTSGADGTFAFDAYFSDEREKSEDPDDFFEEDDNEGDDDPSNDSVYLDLKAIGYTTLQDWGSSHIKAKQIDVEGGVQLYMERSKPLDVEVQLRNPPNEMGDLVYILDSAARSIEGHGYLDVGGFAMAVKPDKTGKATFTIPTGTNYTLSAVGTGHRSMRKVRPVSDARGKQVRELKLEGWESKSISGRIRDRRTSEAVAGCLLTAKDSRERGELAVSQADGTFTLFVSAESKGRTSVAVSCAGFEEGIFSSDMPTGARQPLGLGAAVTGDDGALTIELNPLVDVQFSAPLTELQGKAGDVLLLRSGNHKVRAKVPGNGDVVMEGVPWGCEKVELGIAQADGYNIWKLYDVSAESWKSAPPFKLELKKPG